MAPSREGALRRALEEYDIVRNIINSGIQDYNAVQQLVLTNRIRIPISHRAIVKRLFCAQTVSALETPDETHQWLKTHYNDVLNLPIFEEPPFNCENYDQLFHYSTM